MAEPQVLTLDDIQNSPRLRELGVLPGDEILNNKIQRKFSSEEDSIDLGTKLSEQDILWIFARSPDSLKTQNPDPKSK